jgi:WhiB family transcriptional regulator, redox-sensing transcriptional regulator
MGGRRVRIELGIQPTWMRHGLCREIDPDLFFPNKGANEREVREAKAVCRACSVTTECLTYAMKHPMEEGIWGGTSGRERAILAAQRDRKRLHRAYSD